MPDPMPTEKMTKEEIIIANKEYLFPAVFHFYQEPLVIARGKDQYVWLAGMKRQTTKNDRLSHLVNILTYSERSGTDHRLSWSLMLRLVSLALTRERQTIAFCRLSHLRAGGSGAGRGAC